MEAMLTDGNTWGSSNPTMGPGDDFGPGFDMRRDFQTWDPPAGDFPIQLQDNTDTDPHHNAENGFEAIDVRIGSGAPFGITGGDEVFRLLQDPEVDLISRTDTGQNNVLAYQPIGVNAFMAHAADNGYMMTPSDFWNTFGYTGMATNSAASSVHGVRRVTMLRLGDVMRVPLHRVSVHSARLALSPVGFKLEYVPRAASYRLDNRHKFEFSYVGDTAAPLTASRAEFDESAGFEIYRSTNPGVPCLQLVPCVFPMADTESGSADLTLEGESAFVTGFYYDHPHVGPMVGRACDLNTITDAVRVHPSEIGHFSSPQVLFRQACAP